MAFYQFNGEGTPSGRILRTGLDNLRDAIYKLSRVNAVMSQATDDQIVALFGVSASNGQTAAQQAAALKAELASGVGKLLTDASQTNVNAALNQLLAQTG